MEGDLHAHRRPDVSDQDPTLAGPPARRRVVVTGLGAVTPIGLDAPSFWESCLKGRIGVRGLTYPWISEEEFRTRIGAPLEGFDLTQHGFQAKDLKTMDPACWYALGATREALLMAGFELVRDDERQSLYRIDGVDATRVATVIGSGVGGLTSFETVHRQWAVHGTFKATAWMRYGLPMLIPNAPTANVAIRFGLKGECSSAPTACAAGTMSIGDAYRIIASGEADVAVAGGAEAILTDHDGLGLRGFELLRVMSTRNDEPERSSRPFDTGRDGFVLGEGAGVLVLESADHAVGRGARPLAEMLAYATTCDAHSMMQPDPAGTMVQRAMELVLSRAGLAPSDVGYVNAHATSTQAGDKVEAAVLRRVFGSTPPAVSATKSMTGHCIGASGGIEAVATVRTLMDQTIHATQNLEDIDPECEADHVVGAPRQARVDVALSSSFGFGGHDAVLAFRRV